MDTVLVIGLGEVGKPLYDIIKESGHYRTYGYDIDRKKIPVEQDNIPEEIDILHICYPCNEQDKFIDITVNYIKKFKPRLVIINSTVPPKTTYRIYEKTGIDIVHSPVRGLHEHMKDDLLFWTKYIGGVDERASLRASEHFNTIGIKTKILRSPIETELAKLFNTTYRALLISWFQEMHRISRKFNADFLDIIDFIADTHKVRLDRPIFYPDIIGGHCLIPNTILLQKSYDSGFLREILESNRKRKGEIGNLKIRKEIGMIKKFMEKLDKEIRSANDY